MRDRLIELLGEFPIWNSTMKERWMPQAVEKLADHLLAAGVIVPIVNVGDKVYRIQGCDLNPCVWSWNIVKICIFEDELIYVDDSDNIIHDDDFGETVFATQEESEKALEERREG